MALKRKQGRTGGAKQPKRIRRVLARRRLRRR
jgi:hypothetical protein